MSPRPHRLFSTKSATNLHISLWKFQSEVGVTNKSSNWKMKRELFIADLKTLFFLWEVLVNPPKHFSSFKGKWNWKLILFFFFLRWTGGLRQNQHFIPGGKITASSYFILKNKSKWYFLLLPGPKNIIVKILPSCLARIINVD